MVKKILILFFVFCIFMSASYSNGNVVIAGIKGDEAEVDVMGNGDFQECKKGTVLRKNSVVVTGMDTQVLIRFADKGQVTVKEMTNFSIGTYFIAEDGITAHTSMKVGDVDVEVDKKFKDIDFSVSTPTCTASVRGSGMSVSSHGGGRGRTQQRHGHVYAKGRRGRGEQNLTGTGGGSVSTFTQWEPLTNFNDQHIQDILPPPPPSWTPEEQRQLIKNPIIPSSLPPRELITRRTVINTAKSINVGTGSVRANISGNTSILRPTGSVHVSW